MSRRINILLTTDWLSILFYFLLVAFGWMNIYAVNLNDAGTDFFSRENRFTMQLIWIVVSLGLALLIFLIDSRVYSFAAYPIYIFTLLFLASVLVFGKEVNGAKSWIVLGPISLQPSEFAKVAVILALARFNSGFNVKPDSIKSFFTSLLFIAGPPVLIMLQPDFGSTLVYAALIFVLYREGLPGWILLLLLLTVALFLGTLIMNKFILLIIIDSLAVVTFFVLSRSFKMSFLALISIVGFFAILFLFNFFDILILDSFVKLLIATALSAVLFVILKFAYKIKYVILVLAFLSSFIGVMYSVDYVFNKVVKPHQRNRVNIMLGLESDPYGYEYNVRQSKIAIGSGGFAGKGFLKGTQTKFKFVPEQSTDFIFCTVGEEWGFLGSFFLIALFVGLLIRLLYIAERQRSKFSRIYAYGVVSVLFFHFFVNIAMTIGLFPVIGIPLPFISYGGSSLMAFTIMLFILLKLDATRKAYLI